MQIMYVLNRTGLFSVIINANMTAIITCVILYFIGIVTIKEFALELIIGVLAGAYTSIFVAVLFWCSWKESERQARAEAAANRKKK